MVKKSILPLAVLVWFSSCSPILYKLYGIREIHEVNPNEIHHFIEKNSPRDLVYTSVLLDSTGFTQMTKMTSDPTVKNNLQQPVQIFYMKGAEIISYHANCYAKGKLNGVEWNYNGKFDGFPPQSDVDVRFLQNELFEILDTMDSRAENELRIILFWTSSFYKLTKSAIATIHENLVLNHQTLNARVWYVNTDAYFKGTR